MPIRPLSQFEFRATLLRIVASRITALRGLHRDERGSLSLASLFALILLVILFGMIWNSGRQADQKVKMQNTSDAATYAGGVVLARSMNTLAFTNHLMSDVFAVTAYLREGRDRTAEKMTVEILANWQRMATALVGSEFPRFDRLGIAIPMKVPLEADLVFTFSEWTFAGSEMMLPVFEEILAEELIPNFQQTLVTVTPYMVQSAADEVARRHGADWPRSTRVNVVVWRTEVDPVNGGSESVRRTLPVVDPVYDQMPDIAVYHRAARSERRGQSHGYLGDWNNEMLAGFDRIGKMSNFGRLWRGFTCGHLNQLLDEEYPNVNLPYQIRHSRDEINERPSLLIRDYAFVGVAYRRQIADQMPGMFRNPIPNDTTAYTQIMLFVPQNRKVKRYPGRARRRIPLGGVPGESRVEIEDPDVAGNGRIPGSWYPGRTPYPQSWDLATQHWTVALVPATAETIPEILSTPPYLPGLPDFELPDLSELSLEDFQWVTNH